MGKGKKQETSEFMKFMGGEKIEIEDFIEEIAEKKRMKRRLSIDSELLKTIDNMHSKGMTTRAISRALGLSRSLVPKALKILRSKNIENKKAKDKRESEIYEETAD